MVLRLGPSGLAQDIRPDGLARHERARAGFGRVSRLVSREGIEPYPLAAALPEPPREEHLAGERAAAHVPERVEQVERVEDPERRHADQRGACSIMPSAFHAMAAGRRRGGIVRPSASR